LLCRPLFARKPVIAQNGQILYIYDVVAGWYGRDVREGIILSPGAGKNGKIEEINTKIAIEVAGEVIEEVCRAGGFAVIEVVRRANNDMTTR
jgi:hypothetical protein